MINALGLMQMMRGSFSRDPLMLTSAGKPIINTRKTAYFGRVQTACWGCADSVLGVCRQRVGGVQTS